MPMADFRFSIPGQPPTVNHMYSRGKGGNVYKSPGIEEYQVLVAHLTRLARPKGWTAGRRIRIELVFWMNRAGRDADNPQKALLDGIAAALGVNDSTFLPCVLSNEVDKVNPRVSVTIRNA